MAISNIEQKKRNAARMRAEYRNSQKCRDQQKNSKLLKAYGITLEQYNNFSAAYDNVCHICSKPCPAKRKLAVDHNHKTGLIRGLLCINCNKGLGNFKDDLDLLLKAIEYLKVAQQIQEETNNAFTKIA